MIQESLQSSSSSTPPSPTSTESSFLSSSNSENLNPTANWNLNDSLTEPTTITIDNYSFPSSGTEGSDDGIYEDHLGLNPSSERIVELQSDVHEQLGELMINRSPQDVLVAAETGHGESDNISFLESFLNNLNINGVQGEAPVGVEYSSVAVTSSRSPVQSEEIVASVDSSPSPMIRPPPPQPPLPRTNRDYMFDVDPEAIWLSSEFDSSSMHSMDNGGTSLSLSSLNIHVCSVCGKHFCKLKSLAGHMKRHPDRPWRGLYPPPTEVRVVT